MKRRRNGGTAGLKVVSGGPSSSPSSSSICFFFIFFLSFGLQLLPSSVFPFGLFLPSRAPSLVSAPHLCLFSASVFIGKEGR